MHLEDFKTRIFPLKSRLYRFARWLVQHNEDAEDIVQEVFLKLWSMRHDLHQYQSLEALAIRMTRNRCLNQLKASSIRQSVAVEEQPLATPGATPDEKAEQQEAMDTLLHLIGQLPAQQRLIVQLRDVEGLEIEEIAREAEMTPNNVRVTLSLGRKRIRELYRKHYGTEGT